MRGLLITCLLAFPACGAVDRVVVLQHLETKQTVECRVDPWGSLDRIAQIAACIAAYQKAGYAIVGDRHASLP